MRTTITLDDGLLDDLKRRAAETGASLSGTIQALLRVALAKVDAPPREEPFELVTWGGSGTLPGIDLAQASGLWEVDDARFGDRSGR